MIYLRLFFEFFKTGLFAFGGGMATVPFLQDISVRTGWFTQEMLADMIAVSESTPGPIGVNMATYTGFATAGVPGAVCAAAGLILPCFICILAVSRVLDKFRSAKYVDYAFYGLRAASAALIASALWSLCRITFLTAETGKALPAPAAVILAAVIFVLTNFIKKTEKLHPAVFILFSAAVGVIF
ncbi:MAG: chromate transporter, partial [Oscillospiraceae bacterium]|nr:chromate transporter [Oscillospiraceae bacterium]